MLMWIAMGVMLLLVIASCYVAFQNQSRLVLSEKSYEEKLSELKRELSIVNSAAIGVGKHLISVEKKLLASMEKQQQLEMTNIDYFPYKQAESLVESGASASQIVENCGLSEAEASLMTLVKGSSFKSNVSERLSS